MLNSRRWRIAGLASVLVLSACGGGSSTTGEATSTPVMAGAILSAKTAPNATPRQLRQAHLHRHRPAQVIATTNSNASSVAVLSNGQLVAAWSDSTGVHAQIFDASGDLVQGATSVATSGTFSAVAALPAGGYVVEYQTPLAVFVQAVSAAGVLVGPAAIVRTQEQVTQDNADIHILDPVLVGGGGVYAFADGSYAASYIVKRTAVLGVEADALLQAQKFDANGSPVGSTVLLRDTDSVDMIGSAAAPGSRLIAASTLFHSSGAGLEGATVFDSGLNVLFSISMGQVGNTTASKPSVAGLANGNFIALWTNSGSNQVQAQIFTDDPASPFRQGRTVSELLTFPNAAPGARVTALAEGGFLLTWGDSVQAFDDGGQAVSGVVQIQPGSLAVTADGFVVLAQVGAQLVEQQYKITP